jgi:hypothetical protein
LDAEHDRQLDIRLPKSSSIGNIDVFPPDCLDERQFSQQTAWYFGAEIGGR